MSKNKFWISNDETNACKIVFDEMDEDRIFCLYPYRNTPEGLTQACSVSLGKVVLDLRPFEKLGLSIWVGEDKVCYLPSNRFIECFHFENFFEALFKVSPIAYFVAVSSLYFTMKRSSFIEMKACELDYCCLASISFLTDYYEFPELDKLEDILENFYELHGEYGNAFKELKRRLLRAFLSVKKVIPKTETRVKS